MPDHRTRVRTAGFVGLVAAALVGCGGGSQSSPVPGATVDVKTAPPQSKQKGEVAPGVRYEVDGDQAHAEAPNEATAEAACNAAQAGKYPALKGVRQIQYKLPHSGGADYTCMVP